MKVRDSRVSMAMQSFVDRQISGNFTGRTIMIQHRYVPGTGHLRDDRDDVLFHDGYLYPDNYLYPDVFLPRP